MSRLVENITSIRKSKNLSAAALSKHLGYEVSNWSKVEAGKHNVQVEDLDRIAEFLGVRVIDLFTYPDVYVLHNDKVLLEVPADKLAKIEELIGKL